MFVFPSYLLHLFYPFLRCPLLLCSLSFFRFVFSIRLYNQAKHLSLRGLDHLLVFQRQCPRAAGTNHRRWHHHADKAKSVAEAIVLRCQLLAIFVERCPRCFQSVFDFFRFLVFKRDLLPKISRAGRFIQNFNDVVNRDFLYLCFVLVAEYLRLAWVDSQPNCFCTDLEFAKHIT